jgi:hypothetical protein
MPWDFTLFPVSVMFLLQIKPKVRPIVKAIIFSGTNAFIFEPLFKWLDFYHPKKWIPIYSFIIYIFIYLLADFLMKRKDFDSYG